MPPPEGIQFHAVGRRKSSVARVYLRRGNGQMTINGRPATEYLFREINHMISLQPLELTNTRHIFDIHVVVRGGGLTGQAGAIRHGISRALEKFEPELRGPLKKAGFLTRDSRVVERKKYGRPGARKRFQFSKR
ncbi:MAG: 30S ribosomal protein S9 [Deltaproteobacteria bacterium]|nr:30S ribosomal protein S9 [Deltaproteobacteria bacterium]